jgi:hypothetical protein
MGSGGGDRLILGDNDDDDEIRMGARGGLDVSTGQLARESHSLNSLSPPRLSDDEYEDDEDAELLLARLQQQNERSWSR